MTPYSMEVTIVGCGPGSRDYVTPRATNLANLAQLLAGVPHLLDLFPSSPARRMPRYGATEPWLDRLEATPARPCVILVDGDPTEDELTDRILERFGREHCRIEPGISTTQLVRAAIGCSRNALARVDWRFSTADELPNDFGSARACMFLMGALGAESLVADIAERERQHCLVIDHLALPNETRTRATTRELSAMAPLAGRIIVVAPNPL